MGVERGELPCGKLRIYLFRKLIWVMIFMKNN